MLPETEPVVLIAGSTIRCIPLEEDSVNLSAFKLPSGEIAASLVTLAPPFIQFGLLKSFE